MRYTKDIFDILSRGGFISQNSVSQQLSNLYDAIEDDFQQYQDYFCGIGFLLEGGNGYYYFSRSENKVELADKVQRMAEWIDRIDFLKTFNTAFGSGFTFRKSEYPGAVHKRHRTKGKGASPIYRPQNQR